MALSSVWMPCGYDVMLIEIADSLLSQTAHFKQETYIVG